MFGRFGLEEGTGGIFRALALRREGKGGIFPLLFPRSVEQRTNNGKLKPWFLWFWLWAFGLGEGKRDTVAAVKMAVRKNIVLAIFAD